MTLGSNRMVCLGVITGAHGIRGQFRVRSFTATAEDVAAYGPVFDASGNHPLRISVVGRTGDRLIVRADGIHDRNQAETLGKRRLYVPRDALPAAEAETFYHVDLIGLRAEVADSSGPSGPSELSDQAAVPVLGTVTAVHDFGAGDLLEVTQPDGRTVMIPFTADAVPVVDVAGGRVVVAPPAGLIEAEAEGADA